MPPPIIGLISPGQMGAAVGGRLSAAGLTVITPAGRSPASQRRAAEANIQIVPEHDLAQADILFSIVPPGEAVATARRVGALVGSRAQGPLYVDWNAVSPARSVEIGRIAEQAGCAYADGAIIGLPGTAGQPGPLLIASGPAATQLSAVLGQAARFKLLDGPVGAASALKMSYAGITKGLTALGAAMLLAANRAGCDDTLLEELASSQPDLLKRFRTGVPDMFGKAERFAPELLEIAEFIGHGRTESGIYRQIAAFYAELGDDMRGPQTEIGRLGAILSKA